MESPIEADLAHFREIPWCAEHLNRPNQVVRSFSSRRDRRSTQYLFTKVLNTPDALPHMLTMYDQPADGEVVNEVRALITLGRDVGGFEGVCHGGMVMSLLDEVAGELGALNQKFGVIDYKMVMTAFLNTKFHRPLLIPATVFAKTWVTKAEGRKFFVAVVIEDKEGNTLASADALFMGVKDKGRL